MSRLTMWEVFEHCEKTAKRIEDNVKYCQEWLKAEQKPLKSKRYLEHKQTAEWLKELQRYKDLEEQGRLISLPCKVGDTVWWRNYENIFEPLTVIMFEITKPGITRIIARTEHCDYRYFCMDAFESGILKTTKPE